jgi:hypothetical protein
LEQEDIMSKFLKVFALMAMLLLSMMAFTATNAAASSPSQQACEAGHDGDVSTTADNGTYTHKNGKAVCTYPTIVDPVGNSESSGGKSQTIDTTETDASNGTLKNKPKNNDSDACTGPGNGGSTAQCS